MSNEQSIRDEIAMTLATWRDGGTAEEWAVDMYREPADLILASPVIRRIQAEALREAAAKAQEAFWDEQGEPSDAQVDAAWKAYQDSTGMETSRQAICNALRAAGGAR